MAASRVIQNHFAHCAILRGAAVEWVFLLPASGPCSLPGQNPGSVRAVPRPHRTVRSSKAEALAQKGFQGGNIASPPEDNCLKPMPSRVSQHLSTVLAGCSMSADSEF